jgi:hypothetical protein
MSFVSTETVWTLGLPVHRPNSPYHCCLYPPIYPLCPGSTWQILEFTLPLPLPLCKTFHRHSPPKPYTLAPMKNHPKQVAKARQGTYDTTTFLRQKSPKKKQPHRPTKKKSPKKWQLFHSLPSRPPDGNETPLATCRSYSNTSMREKLCYRP